MAEDFDLPKGDLMRGKRGVVMGVANQNSIAWAIASQLAAQGAEMAFTYLPAMERRVRALAETIGVKHLIEAEVSDDASMDAAFAQVAEAFGTIDFLVHSIAFSDKNELKGSFVENTTRANFLRSLDISAFSFVDAARRASALMPSGGSMVTLTFLGSERTIPNYNVMGVAKAALEAATRYIARDLGPKKIRCNAISAGAVRTLSLAGIASGRSLISQGRLWAPLREDTTPEGIAGCALFLLSDLGRSTTGEVIHVDAGFHMIGLPDEENFLEA
ncbi:MAG TPA: enoyl-ACP reductase [Caulobacteraceae bacterium]|jgi:enoyl-[acyl-carrier protein] reductase I|nr:enoyl-ACP reductase [Caulobacteraceae bacterium]